MRRRIFVLAAALSTACFVQAADRLAGGPVVVNVGPHSATIVWVMEKTGEKPDLYAQKVILSGLEPGKRYAYDVLGAGAGKGSFATASEGPAKFKFAVYGDTRSRHDVHRKVMEAMVKADPDFVVHTGDLVADGRVTEQWPIFFSIEKELLSRAVFFPAIGNHERNDPKFYEFFDVGKPYYSFDWGAAHFVVLHSDIGNISGGEAEREKFWAEQRAWLEQDLGKSRQAALRFVTFHHPPFTAVKRRQGTKSPSLDLVPLFEKYRVSAVFSGHDHNYQHHLKNGVHYIVSGGGGAPLYEVDGPIPGVTVKVDRSEHFVTVSVDGRRARMEARGVDGRLIEMVELK